MTLAEIKAHIGLYSQRLRSRWLTLLLGSVLGGGLLFLYAQTQPTVYVAKTSFLPERNDEGGRISLDPLNAILGGGGSSISGGEELSGILVSRRMSELVARDTTRYEGEVRRIADAVVSEHYRHKYSLSGLWGGGEDPGTWTHEERLISGSALIRADLSVVPDNYNFLVMRYRSTSRELAEAVARTYIDELEQYLNHQRTEKDSADYQFFAAKADSLRGLLDERASAIAGFVDTRPFSSRAGSRLGVERAQIEIENLKQVYFQYALQREKALSQIQQNRPNLQVLDPPIPPFEREETGWLTFTVLGALLGGIATALWITRRLWQRDLARMIDQGLQTT